jgi:hypothetical protein
LVFLCLWHVRRAWQKNACSKIKGIATRAWALRELGNLMYLSESPIAGMTLLEYARQRFATIRTKVSGANAFWSYVDSTWMKKLDMWVTGNRNIPHAGQDTNAAIESSHSNLKAVLRASRERLVGRRVDWLIDELTNDVINRYEFNAYMKENGFEGNRKRERVVINSLLQARKIPDHCVTLPSETGEPAYVTSNKRPHLRYAVHNPETEWGCCECPHSMKGNLCKHHLKVLRMLRPDLAEGGIVKVCGTLYGTSRGGISQLVQFPELPEIEPELAGETDPDRAPGTLGPDIETEDVAPPSPRAVDEDKRLTESIDRLASSICDRALKHRLVKRHLEAELRAMDARHAAMELQISHGVLHPAQREAAPFVGNDVNGSNTLRRHRDFLSSCFRSSRNTRQRL